MKLEDENFEEEFMKWLRDKTEEGIVESLKKYTINNEEYSYEIANDNNLTEEYCFIEVDMEEEQMQIKMKKEEKKTIEIDENIELEVAA